METTENTLRRQIANLQEQLHTQEKMASLGMLSAGIAHEVQNPLNFVINFSKMSVTLLNDLTQLIDDCADQIEEEDRADLEDIAADLKENMQKIQQHGQRAINIIRSILLQSRGKAGEFLPTNVGELVHEYVWLSYHAMRAGDKTFNISIHEEIQEGMPLLMVIPQDLSRAVLNVMNNACYTVKQRAAKEGAAYTPTINIKVSLAQDLTITITDNGMGMSPDVQQRIFDTFFTTKPAGQGTGLGMSIAHDIITTRHGGQLLMTSEPNVGTTFTFIIPARQAK